ncbi:uncharacterized protein LOC112580248 isoform X5 [Bubalus bubalis]|uniref:uncharacterized protein LOC112580248 isoform X5 n=1 Tax=Bubalus bubalis TaxID=89462 RepID=UPI001E1B7FFB|nr:uncharacterized protein LOC112580248 isoform X5 [Bubalus bubalis]
MQIWKAWFRCFSRTARASLASWILPHSSWDGLSMPEEGVATTVVLHFRETLGSLEFLLRQFAEKFGSHPPEPHRCPGEAQRERRSQGTEGRSSLIKESHRVMAGGWDVKGTNWIPCWRVSVSVRVRNLPEEAGRCQLFMLSELEALTWAGFLEEKPVGSQTKLKKALVAALWLWRMGSGSLWLFSHPVVSTSCASWTAAGQASPALSISQSSPGH